MKLPNVTRYLMTPAGQVAVVAVVAGVAYHYAKREAATVAQAVNPLSDQNVVYSGVNGVGEAITGKPFNLGHWLYDVINGERPAP